ncbi:D-isomer specific 2-hydroxyacid dehydrogenase, NAD binding domain protein [Acididesulfobacillus acetoxydans]|uniref:Alanine dehydrogenase n=2 Tax=Acididesulfobacillus acetoxydans TaxID=1561005 RepID=A0A8S0VYW7_9FIRM|nr:D-isomer specific 2-hydroxyacid dehydrogenase, NAD binding domain protein [Acididesulfobacillus acetoxydans]CEJ07162.1 Alanine dehydrogenase [Acididesulfobacillus acetoxydans]
MTRLTGTDLADLELNIEQYDTNLGKIIGIGLLELVCLAARITADDFVAARQSHLVAVVPVTSGAGIIPFFAQSVRTVLSHLGFNAIVTRQSDVAGVAEAVDKGATILFMADDRKFIALNLGNQVMVDNAAATARGYVTALNCMGRGLRGQEVLVIGAGEVGGKAISDLQELGAKVVVAEIKHDRAASLHEAGVQLVSGGKEVFPDFRYILIAAPVGGFLHLKDLHPQVSIAAPGIPMGLTGGAYEVLQDRIVHDPLQIGVGTMLALSLS